MSRSAVAESVVPFLLLPLTQLQPSPLNPRKHFDQAKLAELAATMGNGVGVIEPLVVRHFDVMAQIARNPGKAARNEFPPYEIIAGERRWRAAQIAGLPDVPVVVKELDDARVLEIMVIENDAREDINALERAEGYRRLLTFGFDIDKLAGRLGHTRKWVYDQVKLLELIPAAQQLLLRDKITPAHAILIARLTPEQQAKAIDVDYGIGPLFTQDASPLLTPEQEDAEELDAEADPYVGVKVKSVRELEAWIAQHCRFDPKAEVNVELFPQTAAAVDEAAKKVISITYSYQVHPDARDGNNQRIYSTKSWKRADGEAKSKPCDRSVTGVVVVGAGRGQAFEVCVHKECDTHWGAERRAKDKSAKAGPSNDAYQQRLQREEAKRKREQEERQARIKQWEKAGPAICKASADKVKTAGLPALIAVVTPVFHRSAALKKATDLLGKPKSAEDHLRVFALGIAIEKATGNSYWAHESFPPIAKALGIDLKALLKTETTASPAESKKAAAKKAKKR